MDFTIDKYKELLDALTVHKCHKIKHDVDLRPAYALRMAKIEAEKGVASTYYFRSMHFISHENVIRSIAALGHYIGYHYEDLTTCKGDVEIAHNQFVINLEMLRTIAPVTTACAHGSPMSRWNSQDIWNQFDIHSLGVNYEPILDTDFSHTLYLTDTGRRWNGHGVSVRDKVTKYQKKWANEGLVFHTTDDIIHALRDIHHPIHSTDLLINIHPQRWMPFGISWINEFVAQNVKNIVKRILVCTRY